MFLTELVLKNFKIHKDLTIVLQPGITGILGRNGKGKSSIVEAIKFLYLGELDINKEQAITLGEASGYVAGRFVLNGKTGYIERHLDSSKVLLEYDGKVYKKATEVKELWFSLLQIDAALFKNVVVAQQGEIPLLFSGDNVIRERVFQKLFMVPNCKKLQDLIWTGYLKTAPPEYPVDVGAEGFEALLESKNRERDLLIREKESLHILDNTKIQELISEKVSIEAAKTNKENQKQLEQELADLLQLVAENIAKVTDIETKLQKPEFIQALNRRIMEYELLLARTAEKAELLDKYAKTSLEHQSFLEDNTQKLDRLPIVRQQLTELQWQLRKTTDSLNSRAEKIQNFSKHTASGVCESCGQVVHDPRKLLEHMQADQQVETAEYQITLQDIEKLTTELNSLVPVESDSVRYEKELADLSSKLTTYEAVPDILSDDELMEDKKVVADYTEALAKVSTANKELELLRFQYTQKDNQLAQLKQLKVEYSPARIAEIDKTLEDNYRNTELNNTITLQLVELTTLIANIDRKLKENAANSEHNMKRKRYIDTLREVYDALSPYQLPRKLIESFAQTVTENLAVYLAKFSIPYTAVVNSNFGIDVYDEEGRLLPEVSGGQKIIIGLSLRLALYSMFGQSFPMFIIDEGTTHLDEENRLLYFRAVEELKKQKQIQQILVIDHDPGVRTVVDQVIEL